MLYFLLACDPTGDVKPGTDPGTTGSATDGTDDSGTDDSGTDDSGTDDSGTDSGTAAPVSFATEVWPVIWGKCSGCHYSQPEGLAFYEQEIAYANLVGVPAGQLPSMMRVAPGSLEESYLWHKLNDTQGSVGGEGEEMPTVYGEPLTPAEKEIFRAWIADGARE